jgi:NAD(P)-dependent dehydrogenase (short-subunit alcohol dehydrogenase family)
LNNAVYRVDTAPFLEVPDEDWERSFRVNMGGPRNICRAVLPLMIKQRWGRIINFSGIDPLLGGSVTKGMAKLGIVGFTRGLAREFAEHEITANCIGPGTIDVERDPNLKAKNLRPYAANPPHGQVAGSRLADVVPRERGRRVHHRPELSRERRHVLSMTALLV